MSKPLRTDDRPHAPDAGPGRSSPDRRLSVTVLGLVLLAVAAAGAAAAGYLIGHPQESYAVQTVVVSKPRPKPTPLVDARSSVTVPPLVGLDRYAALGRLHRLGLTSRVVLRSTNRPTGTVVAERPRPAAHVARSSRVTLVIDARER